MDNITQGILGSWISGLWLSQRHHTHKEPLTNGILRTAAIITNVGDFDVLIRPLVHRSNPLDAFFFHRGFSHSLLLAAILAIIFGLIAARIDTAKRAQWRRCGAFFSSMVFGHLIIDLMTSYGIRLFLPFSDVILSLDNIFIVDPFFTIPLLLLFLCTLFVKTTAKKRIFAWGGMAFAATYLIGTFFLQSYVRTTCTSALTDQSIPVLRTYVAPEPLQPFLRRCLARTERNGEVWFLEDFMSIFDHSHNIFSQQYTHAYRQNTMLISGFVNQEDRRRLVNFSQGRRTANILDDSASSSPKIIIDILKFGGLLGRQRNREDASMFGFLRDPSTQRFSNYSGRFRNGISWQDRHTLWARVWGNDATTN